MLAGVLQDSIINLWPVNLSWCYQCAFSQETEDNKNRFPGAPKHGGWIVENFPLVRELWLSLIEKALLPDLVVYLSDAESNGW